MSFRKTDKIYLFIVIAILVLIIPALFINLGMLRLIDDEGIRALVALEMKIKSDFITPTLGGELYLKKPPVYNWIILLFFTVFNRYNEFIVRLPNVLSLLAYSFTIYYVVQRKYNKRMGFLAGILFLASGRVLFYESIFGLIDITYSWFIFINFILIYYFFQRKQYLKLFLVSYTITGITFLMKTLPSVAFQGITLLLIFISQKQFKRLFSWRHLVGVLPFVVIVGGYYLAYYYRNPDNFLNMLNVVFHESSDKSVGGSTLTEIAKNVFTYSFEVLYNFVPGTFVVLFFITKKPLKIIKNAPFLLYLFRVFAFNIIIFLISPVSYMRYVLMLVPLLFILFLAYYEKNKAENTVHGKITDTVFLMVSILLCVGVLVFPMIKKTGFVSFAWGKTITLFILMASVIGVLFNKRQYRLEMLLIIMLLTRIGFNFFILPSRVHNHWEIEAREKLRLIGNETKDENLYISYKKINISSLYYLTAERMGIVEFSQDMKRDGYYIIYDPENKFKENTVYKFQIPNFVMSVIKID